MKNDSYAGFDNVNHETIEDKIRLARKLRAEFIAEGAASLARSVRKGFSGAASSAEIAPKLGKAVKAA